MKGHELNGPSSSFKVIGLFLLSLAIRMGLAQVGLCNDATGDSGLRMCKSSLGYERGAPSKPWPSPVEQMITMYDIPEFNLKDRSITIFMQVMVKWKDHRISITPNNTEE